MSEVLKWDNAIEPIIKNVLIARFILELNWIQLPPRSCPKIMSSINTNDKGRLVQMFRQLSGPP